MGEKRKKRNRKGKLNRKRGGELKRNRKLLGLATFWGWMCCCNNSRWLQYDFFEDFMSIWKVNRHRGEDDDRPSSEGRH